MFCAVALGIAHLVAGNILGTSREIYILDCIGQLVTVHLCPSLPIRANHFFTPEVDEG